MQRGCIPSTESITGADGNTDKITAMENVCSSREVSAVGGCTGTSSVPGERSGPFIVQKMSKIRKYLILKNLIDLF